MRTLIAFLALVATADGAVHVLEVPNGKGTAVSIGKLPDDSYLFATAGHALQSKSGRVGINQKWFPIVFISAELNPKKRIDIGYFKVKCSEHIKPTEIATTMPKPGDVLSGYGFQPGKWTHIDGRCHDFRGGAVRISGREEYRSGMSGGGIYNSDGKLVAILSATEKSREGTFNLGHVIVGRSIKYAQFCFGGT